MPCLLDFFANTVKFAQNFVLLFSPALKQIGSCCRALDYIYFKIWKYSLTLWKAWHTHSVTLHAKSLLTLRSTTEGKIIGQSCSFLLAVAHFCSLAASQKAENTYTVSFEMGTCGFRIFGGFKKQKIHTMHSKIQNFLLPCQLLWHGVKVNSI